MTRRRSHWAWGYEDEAPTADALRGAAPHVRTLLGFAPAEAELPVALEHARLPEPRLPVPAQLAGFASADRHERAAHAWGKSYSDVVRAFRGDFAFAPDVVARPRDEGEVTCALEWASGAGVAVIPHGGGTSVVGGVRPEVPASYAGTLSLDLLALDRVLEVDPVSLAARIQGGALGPGLEHQLSEHGLTLRFFPQSFALSTLGGWIATRAGGHFATPPGTHIDDLVESVRALTPAGEWESRRLPASGAGPSPDRLLLGSEGTLGVITEAWVRVLPRPRERASTAVRFADLATGAEAVRALAQSELRPSNCRLVDAEEARLTGAGDGSRAVLVLGFESAHRPVDGLLAAAVAVCRAHGGAGSGPESGPPAPAGGPEAAPPAGAARPGPPTPAGAWRDTFLRAPYLRDTLVASGVLAETFETAITWERFGALHERVAAAARAAGGPQTRITCRITHAYPDGPAPYFTVLAPAQRGGEIDQWWAIKRTVAEALLAAGGTITHHHAIGRDHRPWYDRQRPALFAMALRAVKQTVDPTAILNPDVLLSS